MLRNIIAFVVAIVIMSGCSGEDNSRDASANIISIEIANTNEFLNKGDKVELSLIGIFSDGRKLTITNDKVEWVSSNSNVLVITENGTVIASDIGVSKIIANYKGFSDNVQISVNPAIVKSIKASPKKISLIQGLSTRYKVDYVYSDDTIKPVIYFDLIQPENSSIANVVNDKVLALKDGRTMILFEASDDNGNVFQDEIEVIVTEKVQLKSIELSSSIIHIGTNTNKYIDAIGLFSDGSRHNITEDVTIKSLDDSVAVITGNKITGIKDGETTIKATFESIESDPSSVYVNKIKIVPSLSAFAAITPTRQVVSWGHPMYGGNSTLMSDQLHDIESLTSNTFGFAAIRKSDNVALSWGTLWDAGSYFYYPNVKKIVSKPDGWAFSAFTNDNKVISWGHLLHGADIAPVLSHLTNVKHIYPGSSAFAAIKENKTVIAWGHPL